MILGIKLLSDIFDVTPDVPLWMKLLGGIVGVIIVGFFDVKILITHGAKTK
jgi:hypothetical protein